jgi:hypothetical protein
VGDKANVHMKSGRVYDDGVFLYTHWGGTDLPKVLQRALAKRERWDDPEYLARIIFCEMVKNAVSENTGYGISSYLCDGGNRVLKVDALDQTVKDSTSNRLYSFEEFVVLDLKPGLDGW